MDPYFSTEELFRGFDHPLLEKAAVKKRHSNPREFLAKVFNCGVQFMVLDIIENNSVFIFPLLFGNYAELSMRTISGEDFIEYRKLGLLKRIDFLKSNFSASMLSYSWRTKKGNMETKPVHLGGILSEELKKQMYSGKQYF